LNISKTLYSILTTPRWYFATLHSHKIGEGFSPPHLCSIKEKQSKWIKDSATEETRLYQSLEKIIS
jgi:hypothetical protein